jgi:hypothetical protein
LALEKALLAAAPEEERLKRRWIEWMDASVVSKPVLNLHTAIYIEGLDDQEKFKPYKTEK